MSLANKVLKIYKHIPLGILNCVAPLFYLLPKSLRYGRTFWETYQFLMKFDHMSEEECRTTEKELFLKTVRKAAEDVPYYRELFRKNHIDAEMFTDIQDIQKIPFLTKEIIRDYADELISGKADKRKLIYVATSGSTGEPLAFYQDPNIIMREWAYTNYLWARAGYKPDSSRLVLRGKMFRSQKKKGTEWQWDALKRELSCNIFNMTKENLELYCKKIEKYKPEYIHGYMSAILILSKYVENRGLKHQFKGVLAVSETILPQQKEYIENVLNTRVFSFYGHSERLVIAAECEYSTDYHIEPTYGLAEIIDRKGNLITEPGVEGELVATGFLNSGMPLLRYRTGDIAEWSEKEKCVCGRYHKRLKRVAGRCNQDVLVNRQGALISLTAVNMHSDVFKYVVKYQFYQERMGHVDLKIVPTSEFSEKDKREIGDQLHEKFGDGLTCSVILVEDIPLNKNGKYKMVDQQLDLKNMF